MSTESLRSAASDRHTRRIRIDPVAPDAQCIEDAAGLLRSGRLVAMPTETVYGLAASIQRPDALAAVFEAKGRPHSDPLIVHLDETAALPSVAEPVGAAWALAERFWPGPLSLVLPRRRHVDDLVTAGSDTVAVRVPAHAVARALIRRVGVSLAAPSANRFGRISPTTADHVVEELDGRIDAVLDAGATPVGVESTVVGLVGERPTLLRPGAVTVEELLEVVPELVIPERVVSARPAAPGQLLRHYAPATPAVLIEHGVRPAVEDLAVLRARLAVDGISSVTVGPAALSCDLSLGEDGATAAALLYGALRSADAVGADVVLLIAPPPNGIGRAVADRMWRAAEGRVATLGDENALATRIEEAVRPI